MLVTSYLIYLVVSIGITVFVGRTLNKNGRLFLVHNFKGDEQLADSINHLLLVGFYLVNIGFVTFSLKYGDKPNDFAGMIEFLSTKIGLVVLILGFIHFFNMRTLVKFKNFNKIFKSDTKSDKG